jgi:DNA-directed RNA polymerase specialized sigma24 family protein
VGLAPLPCGELPAPARRHSLPVFSQVRSTFVIDARGCRVPSTAKTASDNDEFIRRTERYRRELLAHCYRMLGSLADAEDAGQETYVRAWRSFGSFEARSSERTWLYRIATNTCLSALQHHSRRVLPAGLGAPSDDPSAPPGPADPSVAWLRPSPTHWSVRTRTTLPRSSPCATVCGSP